MGSVAIAIGFALFVWWFSTGLILILVRAPGPWRATGMVAMTVLAGLCAWGLAATRDTVTPAGALAGFTYAIVIWGWLEASFLFGYVTGTRREAAAPGLQGVARFRQALATLCWHELAILATGLGLIVLTWGAANSVGMWTYAVLWLMRISAKLNLFVGVPNASTEFLPRDIAYLGSYFARRRAGLFFMVTVTAASLCFGVTLHAAATAADPYTTMAMSLVATLLALAIVEHWFMVLPLPDAALWRWALPADATALPPAAGATVVTLPRLRRTDPTLTDTAATPDTRKASMPGRPR